MAIPFIKHVPLSKGTQAIPYTAAAHIRYISRISATAYVYAERMPLNYHAAQRFMREREDTIRKNGRVCDKLTIALPREMTMDQATKALRRFGFRLSQGRAPFYFTIQDWNENNPHSHFVFVDADQETGKRVFGTSERDSTARIKSLWQVVCNAELQELGIDAKIDFDEAALKKAQRLEPDNDNTDEPIPSDHVPAQAEEVPAQEIAPVIETPAPMPPDAPSSEIELQPITEDEEEVETLTEDALEGGEDMALPISRRFEEARRQMGELRVLTSARQDAERLSAEYFHWRNEAETARQKAEISQDALADATSRTARAEITHKETHLFGFRKGLNIKLGPIHIKTAGVDKAIQAEAEYQKAAYAEALRGHDFREANDYANRATQRVWELEQKVQRAEQAVSHHERAYGVQQDFDGAETYFKETLDEALKGMSPNDVMDAYEDGSITLDETKEFLHHMGHDDLVQWIEGNSEEIRH